jgi:hypothetical protein
VRVSLCVRLRAFMCACAVGGAIGKVLGPTTNGQLVLARPSSYWEDGAIVSDVVAAATAVACGVRLYCLACF